MSMAGISYPVLTEPDPRPAGLCFYRFAPADNPVLLIQRFAKVDKLSDPEAFMSQQANAAVIEVGHDATFKGDFFLSLRNVFVGKRHRLNMGMANLLAFFTVIIVLGIVVAVQKVFPVVKNRFDKVEHSIQVKWFFQQVPLSLLPQVCDCAVEVGGLGVTGRHEDDRNKRTAGVYLFQKILKLLVLGSKSMMKRS